MYERTEDFKQRVTIFFNELDNYLNNYRNTLIQAQKDQKKQAEEKDKLVKEFNYLIPESAEIINKVDTCIKFTQDLMKKKL